MINFNIFLKLNSKILNLKNFKIQDSCNKTVNLLFSNENDFINEINNIFNLKINLINENYNKAFSILNLCQEDNLLCLPKNILKDNLKLLLDSLSKILEDKNKLEFLIFFTENKNFVDNLTSLKINKELLQKTILEESFKNQFSEEELRKINGFLDVDENNILKNIKYNFSNSITGRMTVKNNSPQILTVNNVIKNFLMPYNDEYDLFEVDITAAEPQIALLTLNKKLPYDIYLDIKEKSNSKLDRKNIKNLILQVLYGRKNFDDEDNSLKDEFKKVKKFINEYFSLNDLIKYIDDISQKNIMKNYFNRPIYIEGLNLTNHLKINYFLQSSAVDLSLCVYKNFFEENKENIKCHFIKHDSLVFSAKKNSKIYSNLLNNNLKLKFKDYYISNKVIKINE